MAGSTIEIINMNGDLVDRYVNHIAHKSNGSKFNPINITTETKWHAFEVRIFASNGSYSQHFMLKKHTDGKWYTHTLRFNDISRVELRKELFSNNYPKELKQKYFSSDNWKKSLSAMENGKEFRESIRKHRDDDIRYGL